MWLANLCFLIFLLRFCDSSDADLPVYMRGIGWNKVQEVLKEDLRLSDSFLPSNYAIELDVNVRGHAGAKKSDFNGTVTIYLNVTKPSNKIELHSNGLIIENVIVLEHVIFTEPVNVTRFSSNLERETITILLNRTIKPMEEFMLQIQYHGVAKMDEYGLCENWDPKLNQSLDSNGPYILASRNFPTGARFWFPCFDEPDKRATFELQINHPIDLNAYSNTEIEKTMNFSQGRTRSVFAKTRQLSTYQVALSLNPYPSQTLAVQGFEEVRLLKSANSHDLYTSLPDPEEIQINDKDRPIIPELLVRNLELLGAIDAGATTKEKLDIIILEGAYSLSIQPGLITVGRYNLFRFMNKKLASQDLKNLAQVSVGNHISVRSSNDIWLNDMLTYSLPNDTYAKFNHLGKDINSKMFIASLHEKPLRESMIHSTTTKQYLTAKNEIPSLRASHIMQLLGRFCASSYAISQKYVSAHVNGFANVDDFIGIAVKTCPEPTIAREFLEDFINKPGKAFLTVKRTNDYVTIQQTRYHSTYFDVKLRDTKTRYTIPLFFSIDGKEDAKVFFKNETSLKIPVPESSIFLIEHEFEQLYFVYYEDIINPPRELTRKPLLKSMGSAVAIGYRTYDQIKEQEQYYVKKDIIRGLSLSEGTFYFIRCLANLTYYELLEDGWKERCEFHGGSLTTWDGLFNNDTKYWEDTLYKYENFLQHMFCMSQWSSSSRYWSFLEENFLNENTVIRAEQMRNLAQRTHGTNQWIELHRFFFRNAGNNTNHRFDQLAETVLTQARVEGLFDDAYPTDSIRSDYLKELRDFVLHNPRRAASMSTEIEKRLEREYAREQLPIWHNYDASKDY